MSRFWETKFLKDGFSFQSVQKFLLLFVINYVSDLYENIIATIEVFGSTT